MKVTLNLRVVKTKFLQTAGILAMLSLIFSSTPVRAQEAELPVVAPSTVHIIKYINDSHATAESADNTSFSVDTSTGTLNLNADNSYETSAQPEGPSFTLSEVLDGDSVGETCEDGAPFAFVGYKVGANEEDAASGDLQQSVDISLGGDVTVLVYNQTCDTQAHITVVKQTNLGSGLGYGPNFDFSITGGEDPIDFNLKGGESQTFDVAPGDYTITEGVAPAGWTSVLNDEDCQYDNEAKGEVSGGSHVLQKLGAGDSVTCTFHNNFHGISGQKFNDLDSNHSKNGSEGGLSDWTIDLYSVASFPCVDAIDIACLPATPTLVDSTTTDGDGYYYFPNPSSEIFTSYEVCEETQALWTQTFPQLGEDSSGIVTCPNGTVGYKFGSNIEGATVLNFGNHTDAIYSVKGKFYHDNSPENGVKDPSEEGLAGWRAYMDSGPGLDPETSGNKQYDVGEPTAISGADGNYTISGLVAGCYTLREVLQSNWNETQPTTVQDFEYHVSVGGAECGPESGPVSLLDKVSNFFIHTASAAVVAPTYDFGNIEQPSSSGGGSSGGGSTTGSRPTPPGQVLGDTTSIPFVPQVLGAVLPVTGFPVTGLPITGLLLLALLSTPVYFVRKLVFKKK